MIVSIKYCKEQVLGENYLSEADEKGHLGDDMTITAEQIHTLKIMCGNFDGTNKVRDNEVRC